VKLQDFVTILFLVVCVHTLQNMCVHTSGEVDFFLTHTEFIAINIRLTFCGQDVYSATADQDLASVKISPHKYQ